MHVSGQNKLTTDGLRIMSIRDIKKFKSEMNLNNIKVIMDKKGTFYLKRLWEVSIQILDRSY
uniref:zincin-like metallopeptidase toxin domain-containing protein n=1 Tax=unclassified Paenibacillus TaxID=185978 RepID=UPI00403F6344